MKKTGHFSSFLSGAAAALTLSLCLTTALAAAGKVSYNFANVALDGGTVIAAEADITAANGQKIPGSILYTDETGGKTNYLPLRTMIPLPRPFIWGRCPPPSPLPPRKKSSTSASPRRCPKIPAGATWTSSRAGAGPFCRTTM